MNEIKVIKAWCDSQIEYYQQWESEKEYNNATNELRLLHTMKAMLNSLIEEKPVGVINFRGAKLDFKTLKDED